MRAFLNWCRKRAWVRENVADNEHVERLIKANHPKQEKQAFTDEELKVLLSPQDGLYWQFQFMFSTLYFTLFSYHFGVQGTSRTIFRRLARFQTGTFIVLSQI